jgi:pantoate--beta-alanine ligase
MRIITDPIELQQEALARRARGERIGFVPTMGYLHAGHTSLMDLARPRCDWLVVSIYVNPLQFGPDEDLDRYPRDPQGDAAKCAAAGTDVLFMPTSLYPVDHGTRVLVTGLTEGLCGSSRPGHFDGVTTVVSRLFGLVQPSLAVFGEKDFQQLAVLRRMTRDLALPIEVVGGPLVRDADGLALSSRNRYLSTAGRARGRTLHQALFAIRDTVAASPGPLPTAPLLEQARAALSVDLVDYLDIRHPDTLERLDTIDGPAHAFVAAMVGQTRLIDNVRLR